jgi:hypothetical protein
MSYFLRVFCQSAKLLPSQEVSEFIQNGYFFDEMPLLKVHPDVANTSESDWQSIHVHYQNGKRPIIIQRNVNDRLFQQEIKEILENLNCSPGFKQTNNIVQHIRNTKQIIAFEIDFDGLIKAGWKMLDCLEAYLASKLTGIIYAPDDGFYDETLQPILLSNRDGVSSVAPEKSGENKVVLKS